MNRFKKKKLANQKLTIIKVLPKNGTISQDDLNKWHDIFRNNLDNPDAVERAAVATGEVEVKHIPTSKNGNHYLTLVRVGSNEYQPTIEDLEQWRKVFEDAAKDPDFKIFTHNAVDIEVIEIGKVIAIE